MQTLTGRAVTMARPKLGDVDLMTDMPEQLARIPRYNGAVPGGNLSVAQHSVIMADAVLEETGDAYLAAVALLHDGHEYVVGDITTPQVEGLAEIEAEIYGDSRIAYVIAEFKRRHDEVIFRACGLPWPDLDQWRVIKAFDLRMLATERRHLLAPCDRRWNAAAENAEPIRMRGAIRTWSIAKAADEFRDRLRRLCPAISRKS